GPRTRSDAEAGGRQIPLALLLARRNRGKNAALEESLRRDLPLSGRGAEQARAGVEALLNPKNVVIVGATDRPGNWAQRVWRNLNRYNFNGPIYPFNPGRDEVWDTRCFRNFESLPERPDHLV